MENNMFLLDFFNNVDIFALIFVRLTGFFMLMPVFTGNSVPNTVKLLFTLPFSLMVYSSGIVGDVTYINSTAGLVFVIIKEFITGLTISFSVYVVFMVLYMAGQFIDTQIGFSMISVFDPLSQIQVPITGNLLYMTMIVIMVLTGGLHYFVAAIFRSFELLPIGGAEIINNPLVTTYVTKLVVDYFVVSVQIAMPIIGTILIIDFSLGLLVKAAPTMNVFVIGMPIKLIIGLLVLYFTIPAFLNVYDYLFRQSTDAIIYIMEALLYD